MTDFQLTQKHPRFMHENVRNGLNPLGYELPAESDPLIKCGTCIYRFVRFSGERNGTRRHTCRKAFHEGRACVEVRVLWPGCRHWRQAEMER